MRTNKGRLKLLNETGTQAVSEMDANTREEREIPTKKVQNSKLPSGMTRIGERISKSFSHGSGRLLLLMANLGSAEQQ